jgi:hypothetical protein
MRDPAGELVLSWRAAPPNRVNPRAKRVHPAAVEVAAEKQLALGIGEDDLPIGQLDHVAEHAEADRKSRVVGERCLALSGAAADESGNSERMHR